MHRLDEAVEAHVINQKYSQGAFDVLWWIVFGAHVAAAFEEVDREWLE